jgi:hypothetical protein
VIRKEEILELRAEWGPGARAAPQPERRPSRSRTRRSATRALPSKARKGAQSVPEDPRRPARRSTAMRRLSLRVRAFTRRVTSPGTPALIR